MHTPETRQAESMLFLCSFPPLYHMAAVFVPMPGKPPFTPVHVFPYCGQQGLCGLQGAGYLLWMLLGSAPRAVLPAQKLAVSVPPKCAS